MIPSILTFVPSLFTYDLLLSVLVGGEQVDGLHLAEVDVVAEEEDEEQLAHILLLLVPVQRLVPLSREISRKSFLLEQECVIQMINRTDLELGSYVGQLFVYPLHFCFFALTVSEQEIMKRCF